MNMGILGWIVLGMVAGVIAKAMLGDRARDGVIVTILVGVAGALLGGWAASMFFGIAATGGFFDLSTWVIAVIGSVVLLLVYHAITNGGRRSGRGRRSGLFDSRR